MGNLQPREQESRVRQGTPRSGSFPGCLQVPLWPRCERWECTYPKQGPSPWGSVSLQSGLPSPPPAGCRPTFAEQPWTAWPHKPTQTRDALPQHQGCVPAGRNQREGQETIRENIPDPKDTRGHRDQLPPHQTHRQAANPPSPTSP